MVQFFSVIVMKVGIQVKRPCVGGMTMLISSLFFLEVGVASV